MDPCANWLILRSEMFDEYYIYNIGTGFYLCTLGSFFSLSPRPQSVMISSVNGCYKLANFADEYNFLDNYSMAPDMDMVYDQLLSCEVSLHPELQVTINTPRWCDSVEAIYDLQGRKLNVPKGLNIIRCYDGTSKKFLTK